MPTDKNPTSSRRHPRQGRARWLWWGLGAVVIVGGLGLALSLAPRGEVGEVKVSGDVALGNPAPAISMTDFDGESFELADYEGKPLVVNFWASWCPSCIAEMPDFERVHQATNGKIAFLGINQSDSRDAAKDLARKTRVTYRLAFDPHGEIFQAFGAGGMPTTVFIDADGNVVDVVVGQLSKDALIGYIERSFPDNDVG